MNPLKKEARLFNVKVNIETKVGVNNKNQSGDKFKIVLIHKTILLFAKIRIENKL